jgi:hypothetical protein
MKTRLILAFGLAVLFLAGAPAMAVLNPASLQGVLDGITTGPVAGDSSVNVATDMIPDGQDKLWHITASGGSVATIVIELAGFDTQNVFGVYDAANSATKVQLFAGAADAGDQVTLGLLDDGSVEVNHVDTGTDFLSSWFGYYLTTPENNTWYSNTALNSDGHDHMLAYAGEGDTVKLPTRPAGTWTANEYVLAWEDLTINGADEDYDDFVVMVESVQVPVPAAVLLGLLGMSVAGLKLRKFA